MTYENSPLPTAICRADGARHGAREDARPGTHEVHVPRHGAEGYARRGRI